MLVSIRAMQISDYERVVALWRRTEGIGLNESDSEPATAAFLERNPELSAVALDPLGDLVGAVLCGHDGRRGYLHHLAVEKAHRHQGIASQLIAWCSRALCLSGIAKCNLFLFQDHAAGASFWEHNGWSARSDLVVFQKPLVGSARLEPAA